MLSIISLGFENEISESGIWIVDEISLLLTVGVVV
jgi:hypothetical protein